MEQGTSGAIQESLGAVLTLCPLTQHEVWITMNSEPPCPVVLPVLLCNQAVLPMPRVKKGALEITGSNPPSLTGKLSGLKSPLEEKQQQSGLKIFYNFSESIQALNLEN